MTMGRGHILRNGTPMQVLSLGAPSTAPASQQPADRGRIVRRERLEVAQEASRLLASAREQATGLIREAEQEADRVRQGAREEGLQQGAARLAVSWLRLQQREAAADEAALERSVAIGRLLAERIIGESLRLDPDLVAGIAREAMLHLWRSRRVTIHAHPEDVAPLQRHCATFGMPPERILVAPDTERERGSLRFVSDFGELDGELGPQLDRLAEAIRQELGSG